VFIIGATGIIGFSVATRFHAAGWKVFALARTEEKAKLLRQHEIIPVLAKANDTKAWESIAASCSVIVEAMADYQDHTTAGTVSTALIGLLAKDNSKTVIYTSGVWVYGDTKHCVDENDELHPIPLVGNRADVEKAYLSAGGVVVRPGCVFGKAGSLTGNLFKAVQEGKTTFTGTGNHSWAMVHTDDLADGYYKIALKGTSVHRQVFNFVHHTTSIRESVEAIARTMNYKGEIKFIAPTDPFGVAMALNQHISSNKARIVLGWNPKQLSFIDNVETLHSAWKALN